MSKVVAVVVGETKAVCEFVKTDVSLSRSERDVMLGFCPSTVNIGVAALRESFEVDVLTDSTLANMELGVSMDDKVGSGMLTVEVDTTEASADATASTSETSSAVVGGLGRSTCEVIRVSKDDTTLGTSDIADVSLSASDAAEALVTAGIVAEKSLEPVVIDSTFTVVDGTTVATSSVLADGIKSDVPVVVL